MIINNVQLPDLDVGDADVMEMYESKINEVHEKTSAINVKNKTQSQVIREQCHIIFEFFNDMFGEGTDRKVFGDKTNVLICYEAYIELVNKVNKAKSGLSEKLSSKIVKPQNRQQRRHNQKYSKKKQQYNKPKLVQGDE